MLKVKRLFLSAGILLLAGCVQTGGQIGTSLDLCCPGDYDDYDDYGVTLTDMPIFLREYLVAEFDTAFQEKGLSRNDRVNDLRVELKYNHINLRPEQEEIDPFVRMESMNAELSYIAEVEILMRETATNNLVWAGSISRIHQVSPGEYMHEEGARPEFLQAFRRVLRNYPDL